MQSAARMGRPDAAAAQTPALVARELQLLELPGPEALEAAEPPKPEAAPALFLAERELAAAWLEEPESQASLQPSLPVQAQPVVARLVPQHAETQLAAARQAEAAERTLPVWKQEAQLAWPLLEAQRAWVDAEPRSPSAG